MGIEETETDIKAIQSDVQYDSNGDQKSVSSDDALLLSMGKEPELKRLAKFVRSCLLKYADVI